MYVYNWFTFAAHLKHNSVNQLYSNKNLKKKKKKKLILLSLVSLPVGILPVVLDY